MKAIVWTKSKENLSDVHAAVFKGSIEEIHAPTDPKQIPGHLAWVLSKENREIEKWLQKMRKAIVHMEEPGQYECLVETCKKLSELDKHYAKKENLYFPYMEKYGMSAPPQVMWGVDDDIRMLVQMMQNMLTYSSDYRRKTSCRIIIYKNDRQPI